MVVKGKVIVPLVQALRLCTGRTDHTGSRGIALLFLDHGTWRWWGVSVTPRPLFTPGKDLEREAGWTPGPVWTGEENLAPTRIRSPDRPARSQALYRLSYPAHFFMVVSSFKIMVKFETDKINCEEILQKNLVFILKKILNVEVLCIC